LERGYEDRFIELDTSWLQTSHVDEFISTIVLPDDPCGIAIIQASPSLAIERLNQAMPQDFIGASSEILESTEAWNHLWNVYMALHQQADFYPKPTTMYSNLNGSAEAYLKLIRGQASLQAIINEQTQRLSAQILKSRPQCKDLKIGKVPMLYFCDGDDVYRTKKRSCNGLIPNATNFQSLRYHVVMADPVMPRYRASIRDTLIELGQVPHFLDATPYFLRNGGIHCGSNTLRLSNDFLRRDLLK